MYPELFNKGLQRIIPSNGEIFVPQQHAQEAHIVIPDDIVRFCTQYFQLITSNCEVIDPLCGLGTIPRVIKKRGGKCLGIEIDNDRYQTAAQLVGDDIILQGDFLTTPLKSHFYDCIFTSLPFAWFKDEDTFESLSSMYANRFQELLKSSGMILLDSLPKVEREGNIWPVAQLQARYLEENGFALQQVLVFENKKHIDVSALSVIMKFILADN